MLRQITVKNFILIDELTLDFPKGMSVFTGETGAGKSLLIDAISVLIGERASSSMVRTHSDAAWVEGVFEIEPSSPAGLLAQSIGADPTDVIVFSRSISRDGKSVARVNGKITPLSVIKEILSSVVDIHSQHDTQYLLNDKFHESLLDEFSNHTELLEETKRLYRNYATLMQDVKSKSEHEFNVDDIDYLQFQIQEIESFSPTVEDYQECMITQKQMMSFEKISQVTSSSIDLLDGSEGVKEKLFEVSRLLSGVHEEEKLQQYGSSLESLYYQIDEITHDLSSFFDTLSFDESILNHVQQRLYEYGKLKRKYGPSIEDILLKKQEFEERVYMIEHRQDILEKLKANMDASYQLFVKSAKQLSESRKTSAKLLQIEIVEHLKQLQLPFAAFEVHFDSKEASPTGLDKVSFLISMNPGEPLRPLSKVASGGELSRLMLGLKAIFTRLQGIKTVIFDEIDTGVSGVVASKIGLKMRTIASDVQVLSVSHLASVAAYADTHFLVQKTQDQLTTTDIVACDDTSRLQQMALMASGSTSEAALLAAKELFDFAQREVTVNT